MSQTGPMQENVRVNGASSFAGSKDCGVCAGSITDKTRTGEQALDSVFGCFPWAGDG